VGAAAPDDVLAAPEAGATDFVSDDPGASADDVENRDGGEGEGEAAGAAAPADEDSGGGAERAIEEADIIKVEGDLLYALSRYKGLVIIDVSDPTDLRIVGRYQAEGVPFEMYVRDGMVYALYSSFWSFEQDEDTGSVRWFQSSRIQVIDVSDPQAPFAAGAYAMPGSISDSRVVGDVLYAVSFENGYCWRCEPGSPRTAVTSLDIADPGDIALVDQLVFDEPQEGWSWRRSIHVTTERMYVAGPTWSPGWEAAKSIIQVVDISDPAGELELGAEVPLDGQVRSRWQMNEHQGVLRVISQPGVWRDDAEPVLQTFTVASSSSVTPLASLTMRLPRAEQLMSVRFDGDVGYAVTFERTDPLFTFDLSDPAEPVQRGELEIPGWLYHMEPRGDRLFAVGFDRQEDTGLAISLFDVADLDQPTQLARVNFGGRWGWMPEDQDRIHKVFKILPEHGLILMPFSGWSWDDDGYGTYRSGVQMVDFTRDTLTQRGVAPHVGQARRAFVHRDRLFAMSDERVEAFDISDRDEPVSVDKLVLVRNVRRVLPVGDVVVELVTDWWTEDTRLDVLPAGDPGAGEPLASFDLAPLRAAEEAAGQDRDHYWRWSFGWSSRLLPRGEQRVLMAYAGAADDTVLATLDLSDPLHPELAGVSRVDVPYPGRGYYYWGLSVPGDNVLLDGDVLVMADRYGRWDGDRRLPPRLHLVDVSDPAAAELLSSEEMAVDADSGGISGFRVADGVVYRSHYEPLEDDPSRARFFVDRTDISDPAQPRELEPVNVPGVLAAVDAAHGRLVTVDYRNFVIQADDWNHCRQEAGGAYVRLDWDERRSGRNRCVVTRLSLNLLALEGDQARLLGRAELGSFRLRTLHIDGARILARFQEDYWWWYAEEDGDGEEPDYRAPMRVFGIDAEGGLTTGDPVRMHAPRAQVHGLSAGRAVVTSNSPPSLAVYDLADLDSPVVQRELSLGGYSQELVLRGNLAWSANGPWGAEVVDLLPSPVVE